MTYWNAHNSLCLFWFLNERQGMLIKPFFLNIFFSADAAYDKLEDFQELIDRLM
jgi:hypothetical protein